METSLPEKIAGEITLSDNPGKTLRKWREELRISQKEVATHLEMSPSVISDYESGRRRSPGIRTIRKMVEALLEIDRISGRGVAKKFMVDLHEAIPSMAEFLEPVPVSEFLAVIEGRSLTPFDPDKRQIHGYTVIDSLRAIATLDASDYPRVYGWSTERALLFTGVKYGRSPMVAVRTHFLKPAMVVYVQPENVDELALKLAELENLILVRTELPPVRLIDRLEDLTRRVNVSGSKGSR
ncbi:MAG: helix-turn-helix domain-containing protein [Thermoplasmata archaeon]